MKRMVIVAALAAALTPTVSGASPSAPGLTPTQTVIRDTYRAEAVRVGLSPQWVTIAANCQTGFRLFDPADWGHDPLWSTTPEGYAGIDPIDVSIERQISLRVAALAADTDGVWAGCTAYADAAIP